MGRSAHFYFVSFQLYFFDQRPELLNICYHDYFSEVFLMMEGKWMLLFVSLSKTNVRTDILIRKTIFGDILVSAIFRFGKKIYFFLIKCNLLVQFTHTVIYNILY